jgi:CrcB protein
LQTVLLISLGAVIGANLRYFVGQYVGRLLPSNFPYGTLVINISASFILSFFLVWASQRMMTDSRLRLFFAVGFCATYSTYSSYAFETFALAEKRQFGVAFVNVVVMNLVCFIAVALGAALARRF